MSELTVIKEKIERIEEQMKVELVNGKKKKVPLNKAIEEIWHYTAGLRFFYNMKLFLDNYPGLKRVVRFVTVIMAASFVYSIVSVPIKDLIAFVK